MTRPTNAFLAWLAGFRPAATHTRPLEWGRAALGTLFGVLGATLLCGWLYGTPVALGLLGPAAASAILLFTVPSGALSQPWSLVGSYLSAALVAAAAAQWLGHDLEAACLALTGVAFHATFDFPFQIGSLRLYALALLAICWQRHAATKESAAAETPATA